MLQRARTHMHARTQALSDLTAVTIPHDQHSGYERIMLIGGMDGDGKASDKVYE